MSWQICCCFNKTFPFRKLWLIIKILLFFSYSLNFTLKIIGYYSGLYWQWPIDDFNGITNLQKIIAQRPSKHYHNQSSKHILFWNKKPNISWSKIIPNFHLNSCLQQSAFFVLFVGDFKGLMAWIFNPLSLSGA